MKAFAIPVSTGTKLNGCGTFVKNETSIAWYAASDRPEDDAEHGHRGTAASHASDSISG
jgi:hypothetical protein